MKGIIVAAGYGTRFLPVTKSLPKEMLPLIDKPSIALIVEEFVASGITDIIVVTSRRKQSIENYFDRDPELEVVFEKENAQKKLDLIKPYPGVNFCFVRQQKMAGSGDALLCALPWLGQDPAVVAYPDDLHFGDVPLAKQMIDAYQKSKNSICAAMHVTGDVSRYGVFSFAKEGSFQLDGFVEKPAPGTQPSQYASIGRYLLTHEYFVALQKAKQLYQGGGEFYHVHGLTPLIAQGKVEALPFSGLRLDTGEPGGYLEAILHYANKNPVYQDVLKNWTTTYLKGE
ncbi:MAG: UTP--glucose-1-phosphate uridylyltransferase [Spirochaetia bacterium]